MRFLRCGRNDKGIQNEKDIRNDKGIQNEKDIRNDKYKIIKFLFIIWNFRKFAVFILKNGGQVWKISEKH